MRDPFAWFRHAAGSRAPPRLDGGVSGPEAFSGLKSTTLAPWTVILLGLVIRDLGKRKRDITSWLLLDVFRTDRVPRSLFASQKTPQEPEGRPWRRPLGRRRACRGARDGEVFAGGKRKYQLKVFPVHWNGLGKVYGNNLFLAHLPMRWAPPAAIVGAVARRSREGPHAS